MKISYKLAFAGILLAASAVGFVAAWSWFLREYRLQGDPFALLMIVGLPASVVVGLFYARQRVPPSRRPPTAVPTATPKPRGSSGPPVPQRVSRVARIARSMLGTGLVAGGIALATLPPFGIALGFAVALFGADVIARAGADR